MKSVIRIWHTGRACVSRTARHAVRKAVAPAGRYIVLTIALIASIATAALWGASHRPPCFISQRFKGPDPELGLSRGTGLPVAPLLSGFASGKDAEPSFDGKHLLFAGKKAQGDRWQVWECNPDGGNVRQRAAVAADCDEPHYLPDGSIVFRQTASGASVLCALDAASHKVSQITFNRDPISNTVLLADGRILATMGRARVTMNTDGTGVALFTGTDQDVADARQSIVDALAPVHARPLPTGHVSVIDPKKRPGGLLFCLDSYLSTKAFLSSLPDGTIRKARIWVADPAPRIAAEAPVESDGSFYVETPADTPMRVQTLDRNGMVLGDQRTWIWVRANESRGCIGCHESPGLSPENVVPMATRKPPAVIAPRKTADLVHTADAGMPAKAVR